MCIRTYIRMCAYVCVVRPSLFSIHVLSSASTSQYVLPYTCLHFTGTPPAGLGTPAARSRPGVTTNDGEILEPQTKTTNPKSVTPNRKL